MPFLPGSNKKETVGSFSGRILGGFTNLDGHCYCLQIKNGPEFDLQPVGNYITGCPRLYFRDCLEVRRFRFLT